MLFTACIRVRVRVCSECICLHEWGFVRQKLICSWHLLNQILNMVVAVAVPVIVIIYIGEKWGKIKGNPLIFISIVSRLKQTFHSRTSCSSSKNLSPNMSYFNTDFHPAHVFSSFLPPFSFAFWMLFQPFSNVYPFDYIKSQLDTCLYSFLISQNFSEIAPLSLRYHCLVFVSKIFGPPRFPFNLIEIVILRASAVFH